MEPSQGIEGKVLLLLEPGEVATASFSVRLMRASLLVQYECVRGIQRWTIVRRPGSEDPHRRERTFSLILHELFLRFILSLIQMARFSRILFLPP